MLDSITNAFTTLPGCHGSPFKYLWDDRRLSFGEHEDPPDVIDELSARLISAALVGGNRLFLLLPDYQPRRPAFLLATALIGSDSGGSDQDISSQVVLYCGSTVGIREQLKLTAVKGAGLNLADAFRQQNISRGAGTLRKAYRTASETFALKIKKKALGWTVGVSKTGIRTAISELPRIVTAYAPSDPEKLIEQYRPAWIAIDIDESHKAIWLQTLLQQAERHKIPVVAWGLNPLSECVSVFEKFAEVFKWPPRKCSVTAGNVESLSLLSECPTQLQPYVLDGIEVDKLADVLRSANQLLVREARRNPGRFGKDALHQHWSYLRALESLFVPYDFYEAEAAQMWGIKSFTQLRNGCERFKDYSYNVDPQLASELEKIVATCDQATELIKQNGSFFWNALSNLCFEEPPANEARLIIFSGRGKKQLFELSLLAYHKISAPDLRGLRTWLLTLDELRRLVRQRSVGPVEGFELNYVDKSLNWHPLLVGLPSAQLTPKLLPALVHDFLDVLIYPHQIGALRHRSDEWGKAISPDFARLTQVLGRLSKKPAPRTTVNGLTRLKFNDPVDLNVKSAGRKTRTRVETLWQPDDPVTEIAKLLQVDEDVSFDDGPIFSESANGTHLAEYETWCDKAVRLSFENGSSITYAHDEMINVIRPGQFKSDERYVESVRPGDRVVLIHGQRRQNFYELLISRVHQHPSMMLHLALIERWRTDFVNAYQRWRDGGTRTLDDLLKLLNGKGSTLTSTAAVRSWLQGQVLCPQDGKDLRRLADVLGLDYVRQHYKRIESAAIYLRGKHRAFANTLNRWLEQQAAGVDTGNDDEAIDEALGLTFGDLRSSLIVLTVRNVEVLEELLLRSNLGKLEG